MTQVKLREGLAVRRPQARRAWMGLVEPGACVCVSRGRPYLRVLLFVTASLLSVSSRLCVRESEG